MNRLYKLCLSALVVLSTQPLLAQSQFFNPLKEVKPAEDQKVLQAAFNKFNSFKLFEQDIQQVLASKEALNHIAIPLPDGRIIDFKTRNSGVLSDAFQKAHPELKAFKGISADGSFTIRFTLSPMGFMGKIREASSGKTWYFEPLDPKRPEVLVAYYSKDIKLTADNIPLCLTENEPHLEGTVPPVPGRRFFAAYGDCLVRTYRMAVTTTGEYTVGAGGQANATIRVTNSVNNVSEIFEREVTVRFQLVTNNALIYPDPSSDPFAAGLNGTATLTEAIGVFNSNPGTAAFDVGIVFGEGAGWGGGIAYLNGVCNNSIKGGSAAGLSTGSTGYGFDNVVAHEIGHQFGATHTMSANTGQCGSNYTAASSWETGGGSSLMAYAGVCTGLAYQNASDDYFHAGNIGQIITKLATATCSSNSASGNASPVTSTTGNTFNIPHSTPFKLSVNATDGTDVLTYAFDQMDPQGGSGISTLPSPTATSGPLFRSMYPAAANTRYFPSLAVLTGVSTGSYEVLPTVARTMNFRAVVRDNRDEAGCVAQENFVINTQSCGAFEFTNLNTATSLTANGTNTVTLTWNTAIACVPTANIRILFSTDGGKTFPHIISNSTANDGTEAIIVPNLPTCDGRFMIEALGNIYFNINRAKIDISSGCLANGTTFTPDNSISEGTNSPNLDLSLSPAFSTGTVAIPVSGQILAADIDDNLTLPDNTLSSCTDFSNAIKYKTITIYPSHTGSYTFTSGTVCKLYAGDYNPMNKCGGLLGATYTYNGGVSNPPFTAVLCKDQKYTLYLSTFGPSSYPVSYNVAVSGPAGATFNTGISNPGLNYFYVIVNNTGNLVHKIVADPDMRSAIDYPVGSYTVYGLSTSNTLASLGVYENGSFAALQTATLNQTGGLCAQLSANSKSVTITVPTPTHLLSFEARKTDKNTALLSWKAIEDHDAGQYILERSEDGRQFEPISSTAFLAFNKLAENSYEVEDRQFAALNVKQVFYRLRIASYDGSGRLSNVRMLTNQQVNNFEVRIHPNPVGHAMLNVDLGHSENGTYQLQLFDVLGKTILSRQVTKNAANSNVKLDLQQEAAGIYYLKVSGKDTVKTFKVVK